MPKEQATKEELESQACVEKRERLFRKLQVTYNLVKGLPKDESVFMARADKAGADYQLFEEVQDKLARLNILITEQVEVANVSNSYEELYFIIIAKSHEIIEAKESVKKTEASLRNQSIQEVKTLRPKLPPIDIPKFKGDIEKFSPFISLYDTLVHNTELSNIQKFSFLKSYLEYPALSVVESFDFIDDNYHLAYTKLVERYTDKRLVGSYYLNKLLQFKSLQNGSPNNLRQFLDVFCVQYQSLKALKIPDLTDFVVFNLAMKVLDNDTKRLFEDKHSKQAFPSFDDLVLFVTEQHKVAALLQPSVKNQLHSTASVKVNKPNACNKLGMTTKSFMLNSQCPAKNVSNTMCSEHVKTPFTCPLCESDHKLYTCPKFTAMSPAKRFESAKSLKVCYACLGSHSRYKCTSKYTCFKCKSKNHHTMLHNDHYRDTDVKPDKLSESQSKVEQAVHVTDQSTNTLSCHVESQVARSNVTGGLLGTAKARIQSYSGDWINCRMIIDPASESSFITESLAQSLRLPRKKLSIDVVGVGSSTFKNHRGCVSCTITSCMSDDIKLSVEAIVLHSISSEMPKVPLDPNVRNKFSHLHLADPEFDKPASIDLLLGVQHYSEILSDTPTHIRGEPAALNTIFGFVIFGKVPTANKEYPTTSTSFLIHTPSTDEMLQRFWESEEPNTIKPKNITNDTECEMLFSQTTVRDDCGRYQVSLPFKKDFSQAKLGSTRQVAHKRLRSVENKLSIDSELKELYNANLQDYVNQDHMRPASCCSDYLLTHHAVIKDSSTTQVRVVFNASEKSDTSHTLNEFLHPGPKLQTDISQVLLSFRMKPVALTADLKQMFRCIRLNPSDTKYTHILWRKNHTLPITEWEIKTLPFGLTCSPYLAQKTIKQLVKDEGSQKFPQASKVLQSNSYIDDIVTSVCSEEEAINLYNELTELLRKGGFSLHKFSSNSGNVLLHIPEHHHEKPLTFESSNCIKLLGFLWDPTSDMFSFKFSMEDPTCTKRGVLSQVARIYDINGHLTPITFWIKYFIQLLWLSGIDWDEDLPPRLKHNWLEFYSQLSKISKIKVPRYISYNKVSSITLIGFCDASERGYAACTYIRVQSVDGEIKVHLLKAKSKVAPIKPITIPRLELNGAVLLSKLIHSMSDFLSQLPSHEVYCYTDSTTVLSWLHTPPHQLKTYVANRVVEVLNVTAPKFWRHVPGKFNAADIASRGTTTTNLIDNDLWWYGPDFLKVPINNWPQEDLQTVHPIPELKSNSVSLISTNDNICEDNVVESILKSNSSLTKAQRVLSYVLRFIRNAKSYKEERKSGCISFSEMDDAMKMYIKVTQKKYFYDEIKCIKNDVPVKGFIRHLTPFLTEDGMLRVGGRLTLAPISDSRKHPYLIPRQSRLAELIGLHHHLITLHGGTQLMQSLIQRQFWIPGIRYLLRSIVFKCLSCYRFKAKPLTPLMSSIPSCRFKQGRAFVNTGVDLAGPYLLKESKRRNARSNKCWVVLFICLSTRAVYIDLVSDLSTASFLSSFDRFIARRGLPSRVHSDLGTNFVGAARELKDIYTLLIQESDQIKRYCEVRQIVWEFNPPSAPNFGGSWESAIKSMKHHLRRVIADKPLTHEEFATLLARIEAILNSRPLCPISSSPDDGFDYLTPGHFLVGAPLILSRPEEDVLSQTMNFNSRWQLITRSVQDFWRRWSQEYIHTLMQRPKWDKKIPNITIGQLVLLTDKNCPPTSWSLGRVIEAFKGTDGIVRVAKIKTPYGTFTRPVNKLCVLPTEENT